MHENSNYIQHKAIQMCVKAGIEIWNLNTCYVWKSESYWFAIIQNNKVKTSIFQAYTDRNTQT